MPTKYLKTWIEISKQAVRHNIKLFRSLMSPGVKLWSVVKSNAYGHGLVVFSKLADEAGVDGFCVDSVKEGEKLREAGIKKPILVLDPTLPELFSEAKKYNLIISISGKDSLRALINSRVRPDFHLKIDSGMNRQGFYPSEIKKFIKDFKKLKKEFKGIFTHFCAAKDINYPTYTDWQFKNFQKAVLELEKNGFHNLQKHAAATGGVLINKRYHLDAVKIGIGLYGLWPSKELNIQFDKINLHPVLSWHTRVGEIKKIVKGSFIGYDLTERALKPITATILPIGYWYGFPRSLSSIGHVLINGKFAKVLGRVSMDLLVVDVSGIKCKFGDKATIIGKQGKNEILAVDMANQAGISHYELITRINPLIERIVK